MNKRLFISAFALLTLSAQAQPTITPQVLQALQQSYTNSPTDKALLNAISANPLKSLALNRANTATPDTYFNVEVPYSGISDQKSSGRCWLFAGTNVLRARAMQKFGVNNFFFSQIHLFFYDQLEKSNLFLQGIIDTRSLPIDDQMVRWLFQNPLSDGGTYTGVADLVMKYGLVPQDVMAETYNSNNTSEIDNVLKRKLREFGIALREKAEGGAGQKALEQMKTEQLKTIYRMLVMAYGEPVTQFSWAPKDGSGKPKSEPKTYTPLEFYKEACGPVDDLYADYVMLMNDPSRPYNKVYEIDYDRHLYDGHNWLYVNLELDDLKQLVIASLKDSSAMYFSCDVAKSLNRATGILDLKNYDYESLLGTTFGMNKKQRILTFDSGSSHAMTLVAVDLNSDGKPVKWKVQNSWGASNGHAGHLIMTDEWFNEYMFRVVVNRKYCSEQILEILKQKPVKLPAWDPMFAEEK
ncbi:MAG: C1 family peptidase [Salinivirgaceae bacterium]|nr:C1 family peptidase [Salinivirgaceae bacterium]